MQTTILATPTKPNVILSLATIRQDMASVSSHLSLLSKAAVDPETKDLKRIIVANLKRAQRELTDLIEDVEEAHDILIDE